MKVLFFLLALMFTGYVICAEPVSHRPVSEAYVDPEIKVAFPSVSGGFRKQEVIRSFNPLIGTTIRYSDTEGHCADVYLYRLPNDEKGITKQLLQAHLEELKTAILGLSSKSNLVKEVKLLDVGEVPLQGSKSTLFVQSYRIVLEDKTVQYSFLYLFPFQNRIVKIRVTGKKAAAKQFQTELLKAFFPSEK